MSMFVVRRVDYIPAGGYQPEMLALVEEADQTGGFIVIQKAASDSPGEVEAGLDGPCLVRPDGETAYHAVDSYSILPRTIILRLTPHGAEALGLPAVVELPHELSPADLSLLSDRLAHMLGSSDTVVG